MESKFDIQGIWAGQYKSKLVTADEAVKCIRDGDWVDYPQITTVAHDLDLALSKRIPEFNNLYVRVSTLQYIPKIFEVDPEGLHCCINEQSFTPRSRKMKTMGSNVHFVPHLYHEQGRWYSTNLCGINVMFVEVCPMDKNGYFNLSVMGGTAMDMIKAHGGNTDSFKLIVEVNTNLPKVHGDNNVHVTDVDYIVESVSNAPLPNYPNLDGDEIDNKIADIIVGQIEDGACLQLGIGGIPNFVGKKLCESDIKDLGCHSEMFCDSYVDMFNCGKLTNKRKTVCRDKSLFTFALGSQKMYDFIDDNPGVECWPVSRVNDPAVIGQNDKVVSICGCINVDVYGNVSSESTGFKMISGTGGQLDYHLASFRSNGGKGIVCCHSAKTNKQGEFVSAIVPYFSPGTKTTLPESITNYVVTEYGIASLKGKPQWQRAEELIKIAHPQFRDQLIKDCEVAGIWRKSNKR